MVRTLGWAGFHAALVAGAVWCYREKERWRWLLWVVVAGVGVAAGLRFFPRYYFLLLPPLVLMAARGFALLGRKAMWVALLLLIPAVRFAPVVCHCVARSGMARHGHGSRQPGSGRDREADSRVRHDTLFVWGYRPELYVYTGLSAATRYLDSQPLSGVPADRHLTQSEPVETVESGKRRAALVEAKPSFVIDGLGLYNPKLAIGNYPELKAWLEGYTEIGRTTGSVVYRRINY